MLLHVSVAALAALLGLANSQTTIETMYLDPDVYQLKSTDVGDLCAQANFGANNLVQASCQTPVPGDNQKFWTGYTSQVVTASTNVGYLVTFPSDTARRLCLTAPETAWSAQTVGDPITLSPCSGGDPTTDLVADRQLWNLRSVNGDPVPTLTITDPDGVTWCADRCGQNNICLTKGSAGRVCQAGVGFFSTTASTRIGPTSVRVSQFNTFSATTTETITASGGTATLEIISTSTFTTVTNTVGVVSEVVTSTVPASVVTQTVTSGATTLVITTVTTTISDGGFLPTNTALPPFPTDTTSTFNPFPTTSSFDPFAPTSSVFNPFAPISSATGFPAPQFSRAFPLDGVPGVAVVTQYVYVLPNITVTAQNAPTAAPTTPEQGPRFVTIDPNSLGQGGVVRRRSSENERVNTQVNAVSFVHANSHDEIMYQLSATTRRWWKENVVGVVVVAGAAIGSVMVSAMLTYKMLVARNRQRVMESAAVLQGAAQ